MNFVNNHALEIGLGISIAMNVLETILPHVKSTEANSTLQLILGIFRLFGKKRV